MKKLDYNIKSEYSHEFNEIANILSQLENKRIYEFSNAKMNGYLATNIRKLRNEISQLLSKIQHGKDGMSTELAKWLI